MKSTLGSLLAVMVASVLIAALLRSIQTERESMASPVAQEAINLSRTQSTIRPVSSANPAQDPTPGISNDPQDTAGVFEGSGVARIREGKEIKDANAKFQIVGDRIACNLNRHNLSVLVLENLTLERVHHYLLRGNDNPTWEVEGVITEYEGANYLLLKRAIVNSLELNE